MPHSPSNPFAGRCRHGVLRLAQRVVVFLAMGCLASSALAGVSPENVIVVVNADSNVSRTIAAHYVDLRNIPTSNVILLRDIPGGLKISLEDFKAKILMPVLNELNTRQLAAQARVIAYSADFPTSVNISAHTAKLTDPAQKKYQLPTASINGLTYFYQFVLSDSEKYLDWGANLYARVHSSGILRTPILTPNCENALIRRQSSSRRASLSPRRKHSKSCSNNHPRFRRWRSVLPRLACERTIARLQRV